jgi:hypothetical protein
MLRLLFLVTTFFSFTWAVHESFTDFPIHQDPLEPHIVLSAASFDSDSDNDLPEGKDHDDWEHLKKHIPAVGGILDKYPPQNINLLASDVKKQEFLRLLTHFDGIMSAYLQKQVYHTGIAPFFSPEQLYLATASHFNDVVQEIASSRNPNSTQESFIRNLEKVLKGVNEII